MFYRIENIPDETTMQAVVAELLPLVPSVRREKALQYKHLHGQYTCLRAWQMLHELLVEHAYLPASFPLSHLTYSEDENGKPWLACAMAEQPVCFSLSHTKNAIGVAIARTPVGIDVETVVSVKRTEERHFLDRTMSADEQKRIFAAVDPCVAFTELWTRKEALVKARGTGLDMDMLPALLDVTVPYRFITGHTPDYAYTVAYNGGLEGH